MQYRKRPVIIEAEQFTQARLEAYLFDKSPLPPGLEVVQSNYHPGDRKVWGFTAGIRTLEGFMTADIGDWIITGVKGEHYPCKPDIFAATYEPADGPAQQDADKVDEWSKDAVHDLFKRNCVDHPGNYEVTPGQALSIAKTLLAKRVQPASAEDAKPARAKASSAPSPLNMNDKAFWAMGWNDCLDSMQQERQP